MPGSIEVAKLVTRLTTDATEYNRGLTESAQKATAWASKVGKIVGKVALGGIAAGATAAAAGAFMGAKALVKMAQAGAALPGIANAFNRNTQQFGVNLAAMQRAAAGTISDFELMRQTNVALTGAGQMLGQEFGKNLPTLLAGARAAAAATGQSADFLFQSLVTGVKRSSPLLIDNTGIVLKLGEANAAMAAKVGKAVKDLTSEEKSIAILNATVEATNRLIAQTGGAGLTTAEKVAGLGVVIKNFKDQVGVGLNPVLGQATGILLKLANTVLPPLQDIIVNKVGPGLSVVLDLVDGWVDRFTAAGNATQQFVDNTTEGMMGLAPAVENAGQTALDRMLNKWADMAAKALTWGAKVVSEFAVGMVQGASQALTAAMNYISGLLGGWLAPSSPPKIMPDLDKWAKSSMNLYLHSMTQADFGILDAMQGPIQTALSRLVDAGDVSQEASVKLFRGLSEGLAKAAATGVMPTGILDRLRKTTGAYGKDLAALAEKQFKLAAATKAVKDAEEALERARTAQKDAEDNVSSLADEYNRLLAEGADPALLAAKRAEFEAARGQLDTANAQVDAAEAQNEEAQKQLEPLQEQAALQQKILDQMFKMTEPMTAVTDALTAAVGKLAEGLPTELPTPTFQTEGIATSLGSAFDKAKEQIKGKLQGIFRPVREAWLLEAKPAIAELQQAWHDLTLNIKLFWYKNGQPIVDKIREFIPEGSVKKLGEWAGKLGVVAVAAGLLFGALSLLLSPIVLLPLGIAAIIVFGDDAIRMFRDLQDLAYTLAYAIGVWLRQKFEEFDAKAKEILDNVLTPIKTVFEEITTAIGNAITKINEFITKAKEWIKIHLPDWVLDLIPHSPAPLAKGLAQVSKEMNTLTNMRLPSFSSALRGMPDLNLAPVMAEGGNTYSYSMEVNTQAETSTVVQDWEMFKFLAPR